MFLCPPSETQPTRHRGGAGAGVAALATVGLFGGGVAFVGSDSCGPGDFLEVVPSEFSENNLSFRLTGRPNAFVIEFFFKTDEKNFLFQNE